ncbi:glycolipid transfer protein [Sanghuangporus baumii]|uniref:Glycolipid transfer protein n=1 Tax=Sanghuangporus baumii TaxID=108892 RepID=A0A9Q5I5B4_SANBA|nr:glycolipid transfer protein [Sanghuangporus baumii]
MFAVSFFRASEQSSRPNPKNATPWKGSFRANKGAEANMGQAVSVGSCGSGLLFTCCALQDVRANPHEEKLQPCFSRAYDSVLRHHHGFAIRAVVQVALHACPNRQDFYLRITQGGSQEKLDEELCRWLTGLDVLVRRMAKFYEDGGHGKI